MIWRLRKLFDLDSRAAFLARISNNSPKRAAGQAILEIDGSVGMEGEFLIEKSYHAELGKARVFCLLFGIVSLRQL